MKKKKLIALCSTLACFAFAGGGASLLANAEGEDVVRFSLDGEIASVYKVNATVELPQGSYTVGGDEIAAETVVYYPNGYAYATNCVELSVHGQYTVEYRAKIDGEWQINKYVLLTEKNEFDFVKKASSATFGIDDTEWNVGKKEEGLLISLARDDVFTYNEPINIRELEGESFIKFDLLPNVAGLSDASTLHIQLVDVNDETNYIDWQCALGSGSLGYLVHKAKATGQSYVGIEYWKDQTIHIGNAYGSYLYWATGGNISTMTTEAKELYYTVSDNSFWWMLEHEQGRIVDFDASYQANPWSGFSSDYAYVRIYAEGYNADTCRILVNKIGNADLSKTVFEDNEGPEISISAAGVVLDSLPNAVVGKAYHIFDATATDLLAGACKVSKRVYFNYERKAGVYTTKCDNFEYEYDTFGGRFTPFEAGRCSIVYGATDYLGNYTERVIDLVADENGAADLLVTLGGEYATEEKCGNITKIADITQITGAIGNMEITRSVTRNGEAVELHGNDLIGYAFLPETGGTYVVTVSIRDVIGNVGAFSYEVEVTKNADISFEKEVSLPLYFLRSEAYALPQLQVKNNANGQYENAPIAVIDGLGERTYTGGKTTFVPNADGNVVIRYGTQENTRSYSVPVASVKEGDDLVLANYFKKTAGKLDIQGEPVGILFTSRNTDGEATFVKPLLQNDLSFTLRSDAEHNDYEFLTITLQDSVDASQKVKISIRKTAKESNAELWLNGEKTRSTIQNPFYQSANFTLVYDYKTNRFSDGNSAGIELAHTVIGEPFQGFSSGEVYVTFGLEGVKSRSNLYVNNINGQRLNGDIISDNIAPEAYLLGTYDEKSLPLGATVPVYSMAVGDVLSNVTYAAVSVSYDGTPVVGTNGKVLSKLPVDEEYAFCLTQNGKYTLTYTVKDSAGRTTVRTYVFEVIDTQAPVIAPISLPTEGKLGEVLKIPTTTATDDTDGEVKVTAYIIYPDLTVRVLTETQHFTFIQAGTYIVRYMAIDALGNTSYLDYKITVR